jgi:sulfonate transport system substrate-binding protein
MRKWLCVLLAAPLLAHGAEIKIGFQKSSGLLGILKHQGTLEKAFAGRQIK